MERTCSIDGCDKFVHSRGWCKMHHARWLKHGDPMITLQPWRVEIGAVNTTGDGYVWIKAPGHPEAYPNGWAVLSRVIYHDTYGPIPTGGVICHSDGVRDNNDPANLKLRPDMAQHGREHGGRPTEAEAVAARDEAQAAALAAIDHERTRAGQLRHAAADREAVG